MEIDTLLAEMIDDLEHSESHDYQDSESSFISGRDSEVIYGASPCTSAVSSGTGRKPDDAKRAALRSLQEFEFLLNLAAAEAESMLMVDFSRHYAAPVATGFSSSDPSTSNTPLASSTPTRAPRSSSRSRKRRTAGNVFDNLELALRRLEETTMHSHALNQYHKISTAKRPMTPEHSAGSEQPSSAQSSASKPLSLLRQSMTTLASDLPMPPTTDPPKGPMPTPRGIPRHPCAPPESTSRAPSPIQPQLTARSRAQSMIPKLPLPSPAPAAPAAVPSLTLPLPNGGMTPRFGGATPHVSGPTPRLPLPTAASQKPTPRLTVPQLDMGRLIRDKSPENTAPAPPRRTARSNLARCSVDMTADGKVSNRSGRKTSRIPDVSRSVVIPKLNLGFAMSGVLAVSGGGDATPRLDQSPAKSSTRTGNITAR